MKSHSCFCCERSCKCPAIGGGCDGCKRPDCDDHWDECDDDPTDWGNEDAYRMGLEEDDGRLPDWVIARCLPVVAALRDRRAAKSWPTLWDVTELEMDRFLELFGP